MTLSTRAEISKEAIIDNLKRLTNQTYKLLPNREEALDWETPLHTIIEEISGMSRLMIDYNQIFFTLLCKLEGLYDLQKEEDFFFYRRTIFECLNLLSNLKDEVAKCQD